MSPYTPSPADVRALESLFMLACLYYRQLPDDGPEQDMLMSTAIEPSRRAIAALQANLSHA